MTSLLNLLRPRAVRSSDRRVSQARRRHRGRRVSFESLERRDLMAAIWDGNNDGDGDGKSWHDPRNWATDTCPGPSEAVQIGEWAGLIEIDGTKLAPANQKVGRVSSAADLKVKAGAIAFGANSMLGKSLTVSGGEITFGTGAEIRGSLDFSGGTIIGDGITDVRGPMNWSGGTLRGAAGGNDTTYVRGGVHMRPYTAWQQGVTLDAHTLVNHGRGDWSSAARTMVLNNGATFAVAKGATFDLYMTAGSTKLAFSDGGNLANRIANNGTLRMTGATTGRAQLFVAFDNNPGGTVIVQAGTVELHGNGSHGGKFQVDKYGNLQLSDGTHTFGSTSLVTGSGRMLLERTVWHAQPTLVVSIRGTYNIANTKVNDGTTLMNGVTAPRFTALEVVRGSLDIAGSYSATVGANEVWISGGKLTFAPNKGTTRVNVWTHNVKLTGGTLTIAPWVNLQVTDVYDQASPGILQSQVGKVGTTEGYGNVKVGKEARVGGTLAVVEREYAFWDTVSAGRTKSLWIVDAPNNKLSDRGFVVTGPERPRDWPGCKITKAIDKTVGDAGVSFYRPPQRSKVGRTADTNILPAGRLDAERAAGSPALGERVDVVGILPPDRFAKDDSSSTPAVAAAKHKAWTVMVYLDGDNDLELAAVNDFLEMSRVTNPDAHIVVQFDRATDYDSRYGDWTSAKRFLVRPGMTPSAANALSDLGEVNMADPKALEDFVSWARASYPADRSALVIWNHGGGWRDGIAEDHLDMLSMPELRSALQHVTAGGRDPLSVIVMDACLMGGLEVAHELLGTTRFFVGSPDLVQGDGLEYEQILSSKALNAQTNGRTWSQQIVASFGRRYDGSNSYDTIMAADVHQVDEVSREVSKLADVLLAKLATEREQIGAAWRHSHRYSEDFWGAIDRYRSSVDLHDFCDELAKRSSSPAVRRQANAVMQAVASLIVGSWKDTGYSGTTDGQKGLSMYFPKGRYDDSYPDYTGGTLTFLQDASQHWDEFLRAYLGSPRLAAARSSTGIAFDRMDGTSLRASKGGLPTSPSRAPAQLLGENVAVEETNRQRENLATPCATPVTARLATDCVLHGMADYETEAKATFDELTAPMLRFDIDQLLDDWPAA